MSSVNKTDFDSIILTLLEQEESIALHDIVESAGLSPESSADRRAVQRALVKLIESGVIEAKGQARARRYQKSPTLDQQSQSLLHYISQPLHARKPVAYQSDFLKSYQPNKTFYLNAAMRKRLLAIGKVESVQRPAGTYARTILNRLLVDLSWNSSRLEGNTYSLLETKRLIELGEIVSEKDVAEAQMILNHKNAIEYIVESINEKKISAYEVRGIHALLSENLLGDPSASGRIRRIAVNIGGSVYLPLENPHLLEEYFTLIIEKLNLITDPFEQSFFSLVHLSYLQAFEDVNKRTGRLVANIPFIKQNLKPLSFVDVDKNEYITALLGVYEKNDTGLLSDLFEKAYTQSAYRYSAVQLSMGEPNLFKLKYRKLIHDIVRTIVLKKIPHSKVVSNIKSLIKSKKLDKNIADRLFQVVESEIMSLHDGNIALYKIQLSEFKRWKNQK